MRVKISTNPPLPPLRAWFPLALPAVHGYATVSSFKTLLCTSLSALCDTSPSSLCLSIDGFELLDTSELSIVRDGDLISVGVRDVPHENTAARDPPLGQSVDASRPQTRLESTASRKRKRHVSTSSSESDTESASSTSTSEPESESESDSETSDSESMSDSDEGLRVQDALAPRTRTRKRAQAAPSAQSKPHPSTFVPPGYGKPQTRLRNLRRRLKGMHGREAARGSEGGPVSGANAVVRGEDAPVHAVMPDGDQDAPTLMSLSLRNKNKAKNFKALMGKPLPPKIVFGDQASTPGATDASSTQSVPRLIPPSSRSSLPQNLFVTSVDVEAGVRKKHKRVEEAPEVDVDMLESMAKGHWSTLEKPTREQVVQGVLVAYKALGVDPVTYTPGEVVSVCRVESSDGEGVVVRPLRAVSFSWAGDAEVEAESHTWDSIEHSDWRLLG